MPRLTLSGTGTSVVPFYEAVLEGYFRGGPRAIFFWDGGNLVQQDGQALRSESGISWSESGDWWSGSSDEWSELSNSWNRASGRVSQTE